MQTQSIDTHPDAEQKQLLLLRQMVPAEKFSLVCSLSHTAIQMSKRAIKRCHKSLNQREIDLLFIEYHHGKELAERLKKYLENKIHG